MTTVAWCTVFSMMDEQARRSESVARLLDQRHPVTLWHAPLNDPIASPLRQVQDLGVGNSANMLSTYDSVVYWLGDAASDDVEQFILREEFEKRPGVLVGSASALAAYSPAMIDLATAILVTDEYPGSLPDLALTPVRYTPSLSAAELAGFIGLLIVAGERTAPLRRLSAELADVLSYLGVDRDGSTVDDVAACIEDLFGAAGWLLASQ